MRCGCFTGFALSFREVEELPLTRGLVFHGTVRQSSEKFGPA
ncbi:hypothetical protein ACFOSC_21470 [Streptantibioticus rubrisoli]